MNKMKLFQINSVINSGSTGRIAEEIGQLAIRQGWESYIAYGRNDSESKSRKINIGDRFGILWHVFLTRFFDLHGFGSKRATKKLIAEIEKIQPDIIHLHNVHGYYLNIELLFDYLSVSKAKIVWTLHDCWTITGHGAHFSKKIRKNGEEYGVAPKKEYPPNWLYRDCYKNYLRKKKAFTSVRNLTLVPVSKWLEEVLFNSFFKDYQQKQIYNGVDLEVFNIRKKKKKKYKVENKVVLLGVASVWSNKKGLQDFVEISKKLYDDEVIVLIGVSEEIQKYLPSKVIGVERTESVKELAEIYSLATIFLNLTYEDTFPTTNLEALACGTPVITYKTGGSSEAISKDTGIVVEQSELKEIRKAIDLVRESEEDFTAMKCRKRAEKYYDKNKRFQEYLNLYGKLLEE